MAKQFGKQLGEGLSEASIRPETSFCVFQLETRQSLVQPIDRQLPSASASGHNAPSTIDGDAA
jgi:hypothetical protein